MGSIQGIKHFTPVKLMPGNFTEEPVFIRNVCIFEYLIERYGDVYEAKTIR